jgi:hypothetical protein
MATTATSVPPILPKSAKLEAGAVQHIGKLLVIFRPSAELAASRRAARQVVEKPNPAVPAQLQAQPQDRTTSARAQNTPSKLCIRYAAGYPMPGGELLFVAGAAARAVPAAQLRNQGLQAEQLHSRQQEHQQYQPETSRYGSPQTGGMKSSR